MAIIKFAYKKPYTVLIIIGFIVFITVSASLQLFTNAYSPEYIPSDTYTYIRASKSLYGELKPDFARPMGYSILSGLPHLVYAEPSLNQMISWNFFFNLILWIITILTLFAALRLHLNKKGSLLLTVAFILCVGNVAQISVLLTETLACCLLTLIGYQLLSFYKKKIDLNLAYAVALMNFLVLVRPGMIYLAFFFNIIFIGFFFKHKVAPSLKILLPVICSVLMVFSYALAVYNTHDKFTVSFIDKEAWYLYLGAESKAAAINVSFLEVREIRRNIIYHLPFKDRYELAKNDLKSQLLSNPKLILDNFVSNIFDNIIVGNIRISGADDYCDIPYFNYIRYYLYLISKAQNILFSILGIFLTLFLFIRFRLLSLSGFMSCIIICYILLTSGISFWEGDRFNIVFYPLLLIVLSYILTEYRWFNKNKLL